MAILWVMSLVLVFFLGIAAGLSTRPQQLQREASPPPPKPESITDIVDRVRNTGPTGLAGIVDDLPLYVENKKSISPIVGAHTAFYDGRRVIILEVKE